MYLCSLKFPLYFIEFSGMNSSLQSTYKPNNLVRWMSKVPHLDDKLHLVDYDFSFTQDSIWNNYTISLIAFPAIIAGLGCGLVFLLGLTFCLRCCCQRCKFAPSQINFEETDMTTKLKWVNVMTSTRDTLAKYFLFVCAFVLSADHVLFLGNFFLTKGVRLGNAALNFLYGRSVTVNNAAIDLNTACNQFQNSYLDAVSTCDQLNGIDVYMNQYLVSVTEVLNIVQPMPSKIETFDNELKEWGLNKKNDSVWVLYSVMFLVIIIYFFGVRTQRKVLLQIAIFISFAIIIAYIIICSIEMMILVSELHIYIYTMMINLIYIYISILIFVSISLIDGIS